MSACGRIGLWLFVVMFNDVFLYSRGVVSSFVLTVPQAHPQGTDLYRMRLEDIISIQQTARESCESLQCEASGRICKEKDGVARCLCAHQCANESSPVCGLNGKTYSSYCAMQFSYCEMRKPIGDVDYHSSCQYSCKNLTCEEGKTCVTDQHGLPHCADCGPVCQNVTDSSERICASNGITYPSKCHLRRAGCRQGGQLKRAFIGECREGLSCGDVTCGLNERCLTNYLSSMPMCVNCDAECNNSSRSQKVCASDGNTFRSYCTMLRRSCRTGIFLETMHHGPCRRHVPRDTSW